MKAVVPAAGMGTRMLPATKSMPKEMLPVLDKPVIQYVVEEAVASGCDEILIGTGRGKRAIEDHFDHSYELESRLKASDKGTILHDLEQIADLAHIHYVRQKEPRGLGDAVACAKHFVDDEPFAVLLGDDILIGAKPGLAQLLDVHEKTNGCAVAAQQIPSRDTPRYGILNPGEEIWPGVHKVRGLVEKPTPELAPSNLAVMGRYILPVSIFDALHNQEPTVGNEIQLTDAISQLADSGDVYSCLLDVRRLDAGSLKGWLQANLALAGDRPELVDCILDACSEIRKRTGHA